MCEYCTKEKDLARIDLDDEDETFVHVYIIDDQLRLCTESEYFDDEVIISAKYCPMCGRKLEEVNNVQSNQSS